MENKNQNFTSDSGKLSDALPGPGPENSFSRTQQPQIKHSYGFSKGLVVAIIALVASLFFVFSGFDFDGGSRYRGQLQKIEDTNLYAQLKNSPSTVNSNVDVVPSETGTRTLQPAVPTHAPFESLATASTPEPTEPETTQPEPTEPTEPDVVQPEGVSRISR